MEEKNTTKLMVLYYVNLIMMKNKNKKVWYDNCKVHTQHKRHNKHTT